jgi:hypothetical protein
VNVELPSEVKPPKPNGAPPLRYREVDPSALGMGLQLSRASTLALTRLQLALTTGDRHQAMAAMDRLHALDAQIERLVDHLPEGGGNEADWQAIAKHLSDQKLALAFEKLALASEVSGPDLRSRPVPLPRPFEDAPPLPEWPALPQVEPTEWKPASSGVLALILAVLVTVALGAAVLLMTTI